MAGQLWGVCEVTRIQASPRSERPRWQSRGAEFKVHENFMSSFLRRRGRSSYWISNCLLPPSVCLLKMLHWKWVIPRQHSVFQKKKKNYYFFLPLTSSITRSWQVVFGKHQILNTCCQRLFLSASSHQLCSQILKKKERERATSEKNNCTITKVGVSFFPGWKLSGAQQHRHKLTKAAIPRGAEIL